jgi:hypothetical protein
VFSIPSTWIFGHVNSLDGFSVSFAISISLCKSARLRRVGASHSHHLPGRRVAVGTALQVNFISSVVLSHRW